MKEPTEDEIRKRLAALPPLEPAPIQPLPRPIPTELPDAKPVTHVDGKTIDQFNDELRAQQAAQAYLSPEEEIEALKEEDKLFDERRENRERREGITPLRLMAKYKMQIGIGAAIAAVAGMLLKC